MKLKTIDYLKENKIEFYLYRICSQIVNKSHFDSEEHIKKFNSVCDKEINKYWSHIAPFFLLYLIKLKVVVQLKSQQ